MKHFGILKLLLLISFLGLFSKTHSQELKRKATIGIRMQPLNDSIVKGMNLALNHGLYINQVLPNSTGEKLGLKAGAVLLRFNGVETKSNQDLFAVLTNLRDGDVVKATYLLNGVTITNSTKAQGRSKETYANANVKYDAVVYKGNKLRSILYSPKNIIKPPVVFFIQGYICQTVEMRPNNPAKKLINDWVDAGFAVYRVEKPGIGDSDSSKKCRDLNYNEEQIAFDEAYKVLIKNSSIDRDNIFIFGHSLGGVVAPLLAKRFMPKGIMAYGTTGKNWYDYMVDLYTTQPKLTGVSEKQIKEDNKVNLPFIKDLLVNKFSAQQILNNTSYKTFLNTELESFSRGQYLDRDIIFWQTLSNIDLPNLWAQTNTNVLILYGEYDIQSINDSGSKIIVDNVNKNFKGKAIFKQIDKTEHGFVKFESMQNHLNALRTGTYWSHARENYNKEISIETISWMKSKI